MAYFNPMQTSSSSESTYQDLLHQFLSLYANADGNETVSWGTGDYSVQTQSSEYEGYSTVFDARVTVNDISGLTNLDRFLTSAPEVSVGNSTAYEDVQQVNTYGELFSDHETLLEQLAECQATGTSMWEIEPYLYPSHSPQLQAQAQTGHYLSRSEFTYFPSTYVVNDAYGYPADMTAPPAQPAAFLVDPFIPAHSYSGVHEALPMPASEASPCLFPPNTPQWDEPRMSPWDTQSNDSWEGETTVGELLDKDVSRSNSLVPSIRFTSETVCDPCSPPGDLRSGAVTPPPAPTCSRKRKRASAASGAGQRSKRTRTATVPAEQVEAEKNAGIGPRFRVELSVPEGYFAYEAKNGEVIYKRTVIMKCPLGGCMDPHFEKDKTASRDHLLLHHRNLHPEIALPILAVTKKAQGSSPPPNNEVKGEGEGSNQEAKEGKGGRGARITCPICLISTGALDFARHLLKHDTMPPYWCDMCGTYYMSREDTTFLRHWLPCQEKVGKPKKKRETHQ